ncbi:NGG1p interacting factor NIF3 [Archangium minus]|uniref:NGG1p interacting factor NIF3 n=1 Tax=Archangium minus TaxID=83450 RepID=A0ABY9WWM9_9BACT|nr:NGG1p interacting factor NIF3 [Archangium minus]
MGRNSLHLPALGEVVEYIDHSLGASAETGERTRVVLARAEPVGSLGLALEPWAELAEWGHTERLDALFLHRHWRLDTESLPSGLGVIANHAPFDERLGLGFNRPLAEALGLGSLVPFGERAGQSLGMVGSLSPLSSGELVQRLEQLFGAVEDVVPGSAGQVDRIAVARAMNDGLVREAAGLGATVYVTGQLRVPAQRALADTGMFAIALGHARSEHWSLKLLVQLLRERWPLLRTVIAPAHD